MNQSWFSIVIPVKSHHIINYLKPYQTAEKHKSSYTRYWLYSMESEQEKGNGTTALNTHTTWWALDSENLAVKQAFPEYASILEVVLGLIVRLL